MPTDAPQPSFVLIRPQMGENIGAAARAMWNFGRYLRACFCGLEHENNTPLRDGLTRNHTPHRKQDGHMAVMAANMALSTYL